MKFQFGVVIFPKFRCDYQCRTLNFIEQGAVLIQFLFFLGGGGGEGRDDTYTCKSVIVTLLDL